MVLESAQLLSTAHRVLDGVEYIDSSGLRKVKRWKLYDARESVLYSATHMNHPSAIWARTSVENYNWLVEHFFALATEYTFRYGKTHKCYGMGHMLQSPPFGLKDWSATKMPCAMAEEYIVSDDPVINYRNYYKNGKTHLHTWSKRDRPTWIGN